MKHHDQVADAFGTTAAAYLTSTVHATGADLQTLADAVSATFDWVVSRMSAHHWHDMHATLAEVRRVLKPGGRVLMIDIAGNDHPLLDTYLQAAEVLRDASHVRDYRADEWLAMFRAAGFDAQVHSRWRLPIDFDTWVARIRTPADSVAGIRALWAHAPDEVRGYYAVQADGSFEHDALLIDAH